MKPPFTARREKLCAAGERALRLAVKALGHAARGANIRQTWAEANAGELPPAQSFGQWRLIFEPAVADGRVLQRRVGPAFLFSLANDPQSLVLPGRNITRAVLERYAIAEAILRYALQKHGALVSSRQILEAWPEIHSSPPPSIRHHAPSTSWQLIFAPGLADGRVTTLAHGREFLYGLADETQRPPLRIGREHSACWEQRCDEVAEAICHESSRSGAMVTREQIFASWNELRHADELPIRKNLTYAIDSLIRAGKVLRLMWRRKNYYSPADRPDLIPPLPSSRLGKVEEAIYRAVERLHSAVPCTEIRAETKRAPGLALDDGSDVTQCLTKLIRCGRIVSVPALRPSAHNQYYSTPDGPRDVRVGAEYPLDRLYRAVLSLWNHTGGRPFTGAALRLHAEAHPGFIIPTYSRSSWAHGVSQLEKGGAVTRIEMSDGLITRWAPTEEWNKLGKADQEQRLQWLGPPEFQATASPPESADMHASAKRCEQKESGLKVNGYHLGAPPLGLVLRRLVAATKDDFARKQSNEERASLVRRRPVTTREITKTAKRRPELVPPLTWALRYALNHAARLRSQGKTREVAAIGRVLNSVYYDLEDTPEGRAYVAYNAALREALRPEIRRSLRNLRSAAQASATGVIPLPEDLVAARADLLMADIRSSKEALERTSGSVTLLVEERVHIGKIQRELDEMLTQAALLRPPVVLASFPEHRLNPSTDVVDVRFARRCLDGLVHSRYAAHRMLSVALCLIPVIRDESIDANDVIGGKASGKARRTECFLERVGFVCYAMSRWASIRLASLSSQASYVLGDLRDRQLLIAGLRPGNLAVHPLMAAALAILDDPESRDALVAYISTFLAPGGFRSTSLPAVEVAVLGLAPLPFAGLASELRDHERQVLMEVANAPADADLRWTARRVLASWDEHWTRDQLLQL